MSDIPTSQSSVDQAGIALLDDVIARGRRFLERTDLAPGTVKLWVGSVRMALRKIYGAESEALELLRPVEGPLSANDARLLLDDRLRRVTHLHTALLGAARQTLSRPQHERVFIGHGGSPVWRELKDFLVERLSLEWEEFNRASVAGVATGERLHDMLDSSTFAFLIMTAEDEHADATYHARANVIHEIGLFQGRLGTRRAIILLEEGCHEFSNIHGLSRISFPRNRISAAFEDVRRVLEREQVIGR